MNCEDPRRLSKVVTGIFHSNGIHVLPKKNKKSCSDYETMANHLFQNGG